MTRNLESIEKKAILEINWKDTRNFESTNRTTDICLVVCCLNKNVISRDESELMLENSMKMSVVVYAYKQVA